jgi:HAD superfamily hydrolase (TIGR01450 family)|uniref:HAD-IIA family hydrolase n=2 Tax=Cephaloticoccus sp. TaxID=1985742 RepID=UPI00404B8D20
MDGSDLGVMRLWPDKFRNWRSTPHFIADNFATYMPVKSSSLKPPNLGGYLLDLDGVLYRGSQAIAGAADFIQRLRNAQRPFCCITNHTCRTPPQISRKLKGMGIPVEPKEVLTAGQATASWLSQRGATKIFAIGERAFISALKAEGIDPNSATPSHVVVGLDRRVSYARLMKAAQWLLKGVPFIATNPDMSYPTEAGSAPECGFYLAGLERMSGRVPTVVGKPGPFMFRLAAARLGLKPSRLTMIGDRLDTDVAGAKRAKMRSVLVLSGHTTRAMAQRARIKPDLVIRDVGRIVNV